MPRFDLIDEYTCVFVPRCSRRGARAEIARPSSSASSRSVNARWRSTLAATVGLAILVIAAVTL